VHSNVVRLIAFDFVLWIGLARVMDIAFVFHVFGVHPDDFAPDPAGFRIPAHMRADSEPLGQPLDHDEHPPPNDGAGDKDAEKTSKQCGRFRQQACRSLWAAQHFETYSSDRRYREAKNGAAQPAISRIMIAD
jgi:hypothetical protein